MDDTKLPSTEYVGSNLPVTQADFEALSDQRKMLLDFVAKQLRKDVDYGVIPGTPKSSLFKPGAEKLLRLFGLGVRFVLSDKEIDRRENYASYTYKAEVFHLKSGQVIAECEASCNSQEKKYKERTAWVWSNATNRKEAVKESTPIADIQNTLMKMSQKRAMVGGVILAVGASDFFTQDIDDIEDARTVGVIPEVRSAPSSIPNVTKATNEIHQTAGGTETYEAKALTTIEQKDMCKAAGFRWNAATRMWTKRITPAEAAELPFQTERVG